MERDYANGASTGALTSDLTLYPHFTSSTTNGGVTLSSNTMTRNSTTGSGITVTYNRGDADSTSTVPSKQVATDTINYSHTGWATSVDGSSWKSKGAATGALTSNISVYPYFTVNRTTGSVTLATNNMTKSPRVTSTYTVTYNYNGNGSSNTTATANRTVTYTAIGWATASGASTANYSNGESVSVNLNLYPAFSHSASTSSVTLPSPTRTGYTFNGWYTAASGGTKVGDASGSYTPTGNKTLYAQWTVNTYTISYPAMPTGVASFKIYHNGSAVVNNPTSAGSVQVAYGNVYASATAATGYEAPTITGITTSTSGATITSNLTVTLTAGAKIVERDWVTIWSGSKSITLKANQTGELATIFNFSPYPANGSTVRIACAYGVGGTTTYYSKTVTYNADGSYTLDSPIDFTNSSNGAIELRITGFDATNLYYTRYSSTLSTLKVTLVELLAPTSAKLSAPEIGECYLDTGTELIVDIINNNNTDVIWYATVYDSYGTVMGSGSYTLEAYTTAPSILFDLDSSITEGYIEIYFTADGYEDSDIAETEF